MREGGGWVGRGKERALLKTNWNSHNLLITRACWMCRLIGIGSETRSEESLWRCVLPGGGSTEAPPPPPPPPPRPPPPSPPPPPPLNCYSPTWRTRLIQSLASSHQNARPLGASAKRNPPTVNKDNRIIDSSSRSKQQQQQQQQQQQ